MDYLKFSSKLPSAIFLNIQTRFAHSAKPHAKAKATVVSKMKAIRNKKKERKAPLSRELREEFAKYKGQKPIISCKRVEFNFYEGMRYDKFTPVPLASKSWLHRRSVGDYFTLYEGCTKPIEDIHFPCKIPPQLTHIFENPEETRKELSFQDLKINEALIQNLANMGITSPASVQVSAIPVTLAGTNAIISAHPGCGKTLAYLLPVVQHVLERKKKDPLSLISCPLAVIVTPSRELAQQIGSVTMRLTEGLNISTRVIVGGETSAQIASEKPAVVDILIGSLGTLLKNIKMGVFHTKMVRHVVLDEADQLLDDINSANVRSLLDRMPIRDNVSKFNPQDSMGAQLSLVSATIPTNLTKRFQNIVDMSNIKRIESNYLHRMIPSVSQKFLRIGKLQKAPVLVELIKKDVNEKSTVLIFCNKSKTADWASLMLNSLDIPCRNFTAEVPRAIKNKIFPSFQAGEFNVLATTSMAARGLDTVRVNHVINLEFPLYMSDYIHRIGRVGRIGNTQGCHVTNIVTHAREIALVQQIETAVRTKSDLHNVNANIPGIISFRRERAEEHAQFASMIQEHISKK